MVRKCRKRGRMAYNLVELFVLLVSIVGEVIVKIVLGDGINNVVCHICDYLFKFYSIINS